ncbi:SDR family oxidoreductase [Pararhodobacter oceanensis]|uniref:SDR family oxidoreductase n=1 Tax=Pararhodobacter oceanensis TaxID=2172121 RepID=UPI003A945221
MTLAIDLTGRHAIVCASSRGLGRGCAEMLAQAGAALVLNGRDAEALETTKAEMLATDGGRQILTVAGDITDPATQEKLLEACPTPDILVNNNGGPPISGFQDLSRDDVMAGLTANMVAPFEMIQRVIDGMRARKFGRIVNITSITVKMPISGLDLSSAARAGLTSFVAGIARDVAADNVTINQLMPGFFDTERSRSGLRRRAETSGRPIEELAAERNASIPAGRLGDTEEFGRACAFLCSPYSGFITGQNLLMDGGMFRSAF